jgi:hypothetical protein
VFEEKLPSTSLPPGGAGGQDSITYQYNSIGNITFRQVGSNTFTYTYDTVKKHVVKTINLNGNNYTFVDNDRDAVNY